MNEYRIVVEGVEHGRPFRESSRCSDLEDARRQLRKLQERIDNPPESFTGLDPTIVHAEILTREVRPWEPVDRSTGHRKIVDAWLAGERFRIHDAEDLAELEARS